jgi:hypothetical protein
MIFNKDENSSILKIKLLKKLLRKANKINIKIKVIIIKINNNSNNNNNNNKKSCNNKILNN